MFFVRFMVTRLFTNAPPPLGNHTGGVSPLFWYVFCMEMANVFVFDEKVAQSDET